MKFIIAFFLSLLATICFAQDIAKEEIGNTEYLSDEIVDQKLENQRLKRQQELLALPELFATGKTHTYEGEFLEAIEFPLGGFGGGHLIMDGTGKLKHWKIFNNNNLAFIPNSFFAVRAQSSGSKPVTKVLQTNNVGTFQAIDELTFQGEFPFAWLQFSDTELPINVALEAFNPLIPTDLKNSAIPCAIFNLKAHNPTNKEIEVSFLCAQQNAVGYYPINFHGGKNSSREFFNNDIEYKNLNIVNNNEYEGYGGNSNQVLHCKKSSMVHLFSLKPDSVNGYGDMAIGTIGETCEATAAWRDINKLHHAFSSNGYLEDIEKSKPTSQGETINSALTKTFILAPNESRTITFFLCWHFPNGERGSYSKNSWGRGQWGGNGNMYTNWWNNALEVAKYLQDNYEELDGNTRLYHKSFYKSNYPHWLKDRISSQTSILKTNTMFWDKQGYIGGWEGISPVGGACSGNCTHVWHYPQAYARLFPEMGRTMRDQSFRFMKDDGMIPYRHPNGHEAFDGQCGEILQSYREHLMSSDSKWLNSNYKKITKAMDFVINTWDMNEDGILEGPKHNTLDSRLGGNSSWHGSLYAAALKAVEKMSNLQNNPTKASRYNTLAQKALESHMNTLWNGEYFIQIPDSIPHADFLTGCATDQLLGQWWANQMQLGKLYPDDIIHKTMQSVFKYNFKANFYGIKQTPREFTKPNEAGLLMITWPYGGRPKPHTSYADEVMSGFEYAAAAAMIQSDNLEEGLTVLKAISDRYSGKLKVDYKGAWGNWGYSGNPFGDDECGKFYSRAMSSWSVLLALQGFIYDGPQKRIGFNPVWQPENHISFFTTANGWGNFIQKRDTEKQFITLELNYGKLNIDSFEVYVEKGKKVNSVQALLNKNPIHCNFSQENYKITVSKLNTQLTKNQKFKLIIH